MSQNSSSPGSEARGRHRRSAEPATGPSRRHFLATTGAGVAGAAVLTATGASVAQAAPRTSGSAAKTAALPHVTSADPIVAYISDLSKGELTVMVGGHETTVVDHALAQSIARKVR